MTGDTSPSLSRWKRYLPWLTSLVLVASSALATHYAWPPEIVRVIQEIPVTQQADGYTPTFGWQRDDQAIAANLDGVQTLQFVATPAGQAVLGDQDVFLWRAVRKAAGQPDSWYPNVNQQNVGCCVGCGWKHSADIVQATAIARGAAFEWKPISVEVIYAGSRIEVGRGRISGDGSIGAWAKEWCQSKGGIVAMENHGSVDLSTFSPARARLWGRTGVPDDLEPQARQHPVKGCALVKSWTDVKKAIQQGYPVAVCSDQGFTMTRDATGRARPQGTWPHCLCLCGVRAAADGRSEAGFLLNSWGDAAHTGGVWPSDMPVAGFWADADVIDRMVRQGDSFALADVAGFPARKPLPDWFVERRPERFRLHPVISFKSEVSLSW